MTDHQQVHKMLYGVISKRHASGRAMVYYRGLFFITALVSLAFATIQFVLGHTHIWLQVTQLSIGIISLMAGAASAALFRYKRSFFTLVCAITFAATANALVAMWLNDFLLQYCFHFYFLLILFGLSIRNFGLATLYLATFTCLVIAGILDVFAYSPEHQISLITSHVTSTLAILVIARSRNFFLHRSAMREELLRSFIDKTDTALFITDTEGHIYDINQCTSQLFGYSFEELINRDFRILRLANLTQDEIEYGFGELRKNQFWKSETELRRKDGTTFPASISIGSLRHFGKDCLIYHVRDISEKKSFETAIVYAKEEALKLAQMKSQFLATMSHEIRTPLNGIMGTASLLERTELNTEQREMVDMINRSGQNLLALIKDILDISRMESGKMKLEVSAFRPDELIHETCELLRHNAEAKGLELNYQVSHELFRQFYGDSMRIRQVLFNLVGNAIKFTHAGQVRVNCTLQYQLLENASIAIEVADTGIGISTEQASKLFQPFSQIGSSQHGTGLGLLISKQLVELMGGQMNLKSEPGKGSVFSFNFIVRNSVEVSNGAQVAMNARTRTCSNIRVLVAEDNEMNQHVLKMMLQNIGAQILVVNNGKEAVEAFEKENYDAVLLDVNMPVMGGLEAARHMAKNHRSEELPLLVAITANDSPDEQAACLKAGFHRFLSKPFAAHSLEQILSELGHKHVSSIERQPLDHVQPEG